ncbi:MAG: hypothetical protein K2X66_04610 [Cyanobacteria bacterium]|nr:hypothetical protein [Cyanobacteriota bacterium]
MMKSNMVSIEAIKLHLIKNTQFADQSDKVFTLSSEAIKYLIKALEFADQSFTLEIETVLTKSGPDSIPALIKGLNSASNNVKSTCAMVLIRLGEVSVEPVRQFYFNNITRPQVAWVAEFILDELCELVSTESFMNQVQPSTFEPTLEKVC